MAKIYDKRTCRNGEPYKFQVFYRAGKPENAERVYKRVNRLYNDAYVRYIETESQEPDEIDPKEFAMEKVKEVVIALQGMSITKGAALNGDIIGAFFEEILRIGFKQDKGMYFTHSNLAQFMIEAIDLEGLTVNTWMQSTHPDNRLPYVIDPACGSGTFFDTFVVNEVGFKLSKRKEKSRPNQLCTYRGKNSGKKLSNLHLCDEPVNIVINSKKPETVLDIIKKEVKWE